MKKLLYLGPVGSYTEIAKDIFLQRLNLDVQSVENCSSITKIISLVDENDDFVAVLPIENSIEGIVRETIDNIIKTNDVQVQILAETIIPISHCLLSKTTSIEDIKTVVSYQQAIRQCQNFLLEKFGETIEIKESTSTSEAAEFVSKCQNSDIAAIANEKAALLYNLNILQKNINDEDDNKTRFILLGRSLNLKNIENYKTGICFSTKNQIGALANVLNVFQKNSINLCSIESRPSKKNLGEYNFFVEADCQYNDNSSMQTVIEQIMPFVDFYRIVGTYKRI